MALFKLSEAGWNKSRTPFKSNYSGSAPGSFTDSTLAIITYGSAFSDSVAAPAPSGSRATRYNVTSGALPAGLDLNTKTGAITGTPSASESYAFTITASNPHGSVSESYTGTTSDAPTWSDNTISSDITATLAYSDTVTATGRPDPVYSVSAGSLPSGLSLNTSNGNITGTPTTVSQSYSFTITATNVAGSISQSFSGTVADPIPDSVSYLVIAGSGGSGNGYGGAGGYRTSYSGGSGLSGRNSSLLSAIAVSQGTSYTVSVGGGGAAGTGWPVYRGSNGGNSTFATVTSSGGGAGGGNANHTEKNGRNGGAGGGGGHYYGGASGGSGYAGQGFNGETTTVDHAQGKGGGAGGTPAGLASTITGTSVVRAAGNGGGANSGSGASPTNKNGNSGVVILRFRGRVPTISAGLTYTETEDAGDTVLEFTAGNGTVTW